MYNLYLKKLFQILKILSAISRILFLLKDTWFFQTMSKQQRPSFILLPHYCVSLAAYPSLCIVSNAANEPLASRFCRTRGICGITACKVYPSYKLPCGTVSSYLTFSPLLILRWAVIFCGTLSCFYC